MNRLFILVLTIIIGILIVTAAFLDRHTDMVMLIGLYFALHIVVVYHDSKIQSEKRYAHIVDEINKLHGDNLGTIRKLYDVETALKNASYIREENLYDIEED